jgi:hypothetical protein
VLLLVVDEVAWSDDCDGAVCACCHCAAFRRSYFCGWLNAHHHHDGLGGLPDPRWTDSLPSAAAPRGNQLTMTSLKLHRIPFDKACSMSLNQSREAPTLAPAKKEAGPLGSLIEPGDGVDHID